ncbi:hypothetical protein KAR91_67320 [Candidatus Pacearchaeota archaeon]|nr:hypothetical protein [Candidatus Pacearchaeota archaeon]
MGTGEAEFTPACLDCVKYPSRIHKCLENVEKKLGMKCCGLCREWVDPKPTSAEKLMGICALHSMGRSSCFCEACDDFERRGPNEINECFFDLSDLEYLPHTPQLNEDDDAYF